MSKNASQVLTRVRMCLCNLPTSHFLFEIRSIQIPRLLHKICSRFSYGINMKYRSQKFFNSSSQSAKGEAYGISTYISFLSNELNRSFLNIMPYKDFSCSFIDDICMMTNVYLNLGLSECSLSGRKVPLSVNSLAWLWNFRNTFALSRGQMYLWFEDFTQIWNCLTFGERWTCKEVVQNIKDTTFA